MPAATVSTHFRCSAQSSYQIGGAGSRSSIRLPSGVRAPWRSDQTTQVSTAASRNSAVFTSNPRESAGGASQTFKIRWLKSRTRKRRCRPYSWLRSKNAANFRLKFKNYRNKFLALIARTIHSSQASRQTKKVKRSYTFSCRIMPKRTRSLRAG